MDFHEGLNVIVGANNSGKTGLLQAISLLSAATKKMSVDDFNKFNLMRFDELYREEAPKIEVEYTISHTVNVGDVEDEGISRMLPFLESNDVLTDFVGTEAPQEYKLHAKVGAVYALNAKHVGKYRELLASNPSFSGYSLHLNRFVQDGCYEWNYSNTATGETVEPQKATGILDVQYIRADRTNDDVRSEVRGEIDSFSKSTEVKIKLDSFWAETSGRLKDILGESLTKMDNLFVNENNEIGLSSGKVAIATDIQMKDQPVSGSYLVQARDTLAEFNLPLDHNGLGYNNLINIYMLIKLNEARRDRGFRVLCLEEPEAHLHPAMQYKLFRYLKRRDEDNALHQQIFVTTHSTNISAVAGLDNMFMMAYLREGALSDCVQQSLEKQFQDDGDSNLKATAKKHLAKFLDVTRSDILFADKVILVEGIAERLLLPRFMEQCGFPYEDHHVSIVEIGGKHFEHFVELFNGNAVKKKVLCITDCDFTWIDDTEGSLAFVSKDKYSDARPDHIAKLQERFSMDNLKVCSQRQGGRTFEDELFMANAANVGILKEMMKRVIPDMLADELDALGLDIDRWLSAQSGLDGRIRKSVGRYLEAFQNRKDALEENKGFYATLAFAEMFLHYASVQKGSLALRLLVDPIQIEGEVFEVPEYIREGLDWLRQ